MIEITLRCHDSNRKKVDRLEVRGEQGSIVELQVSRGNDGSRRGGIKTGNQQIEIAAEPLAAVALIEKKRVALEDTAQFCGWNDDGPIRLQRGVELLRAKERSRC